MSSDPNPPLLTNRRAKEAAANTVPRPLCHCLERKGWWSELKLQTEQQDTACPGWVMLLKAQTQIVVWVAACSIVVSLAYGQEPAARPKVKVEFCRLEAEPIKGVTEEKGTRTNCGGRLAYLHKKPLLTAKDIDYVNLNIQDWTRNGWGIRYTVELHFTEEAKQKLVEQIAKGGRDGEVLLAVIVDGKYMGNSYFNSKCAVENNTPSVTFPTQSEAVELIDNYK